MCSTLVKKVLQATRAQEKKVNHDTHAKHLGTDETDTETSTQFLPTQTYTCTYLSSARERS